MLGSNIVHGTSMRFVTLQEILTMRQNKKTLDEFQNELHSHLQQIPKVAKMVNPNLLRELMKKLSHLASTRGEARLG